VVVERTGKGKRIRITDTVMDPGAKVLNRSGITCKNRARHGFAVSVQAQKVF
jgi:hypothetical protein